MNIELVYFKCTLLQYITLFCRCVCAYAVRTIHSFIYYLIIYSQKEKRKFSGTFLDLILFIFSCLFIKYNIMRIHTCYVVFITVLHLTDNSSYFLLSFLQLLFINFYSLSLSLYFSLYFCRICDN